MAYAQSVSLDSGGSFIEDGLTFTISGCKYAAAEASPSAPSASCSSAGLASTVVMTEATSTGGGAAIEFLNTGGSGTVLSMAKSATTYATLLFTLTVTGPAKSLSALSNAVTGSATTHGTSCQETGAASCLTYSGGASGSLNASAAGGLVSASFTPTNNLSINVVLGLAPVSGATSTLTLNNATLTFTPAPEPASIGLLATGLVGLAVVRRRIRRRVGVRPAQDTALKTEVPLIR